jgi:thermitase
MVMYRNLSVAAFVCAAAFSMGQYTEHVPGELMVKFIPGKSASVNQAIGAVEADYIASIGATRVILPKNMSVSQAVAYYSSKLEVVYAEPNYIYRAAWTPNDPRLSQQYAMPRTKAIEGWDQMRGAPDIVIAIVDTGVDYNHEDLAAKMLPGYDFVDDDADPMDLDGHGTHCAGIAAAATNNGIGVAGMAPNCSVMPVRVLGPGGGTAAWVAGGITYAADNGAHVISMSLAGGSPSTAIHDACKYSITRGAIPIAAAGNHGTTQMVYPAGHPEVLAVANTDQNDNRNPSSAYGDWVDVAAPGTSIMSTLPGNSYGNNTGTSMACPYVAGLAGLIKSTWRAATPVQIRNQIQNNSDFVGTFVKYGRINVLRSVPTLVTTDPYALAPNAASMFEGTVTAGGVAQIAASDNSYFTVVSKAVNRVGHVGSMRGTFKTNRDPRTISQLSLDLEVNAPSRVTANFFIWDNSTSKWQYVGAFPMNGTDIKKSFSFTAPYTKYWNANRELQVLVRCVWPQTMSSSAKQFTMKVDHLRLNGRIPR